ncbi:hypothetical protein B0T14DRAFT_325717 [Immersiella caudata]|uniref:Uncharacterized protein n=1 Tax=Immersiella caudata TaxID=314043 RepID=A0AA39WBZ3_9PEZI|nr:hypothetical protein B0T14DRAFT_325717 [Immersiella caudata]
MILPRAMNMPSCGLSSSRVDIGLVYPPKGKGKGQGNTKAEAKMQIETVTGEVAFVNVSAIRKVYAHFRETGRGIGLGK